MTSSYSNLEVRLFNSPLETGIRALVILNDAFPKMFDLSLLTWLDHLVVHTGDIGGPESLHPDLPHRSGELLVRRKIIEEGLTLMRRLHLVDIVADDGGILYQATEEAHPFVELMRTPYARAMKERARWITENISTMDDADIKEFIVAKIGRWNVEFHHDTDSSRRLL